MVGNPVLLYAPSLPLTNNIQIGPWLIGVPPEGVRWQSDKFRSLTLAYVRSMEAAYGKGALVWHGDRGLDGNMPSVRQWQSLELALTFGLLERNDHVRNDLNAGHIIATSENGRIVVQRMDVTSGYITHLRDGFLRTVMDGGHRIGESAPPIAAGTERIRMPVNLSTDAVCSLYLRLVQARPRDEKLRVACEWLSTAMQNSSAVTVQQRFIALKTAFEAITETSNSRNSAERLVGIFRRACGAYVHLLPWNGILWSPREMADIARVWLGKKRRVVKYTDLEDWFMQFSEVRNGIIHGGVVSAMAYSSPRKSLRKSAKRYDGVMLWTAERLLREAVKAKLGPKVLLSDRIKQYDYYEALGAELSKAMRRDEDGPSSARKSVDVPVNIEPLLGALRAVSAADVEVDTVRVSQQLDVHAVHAPVDTEFDDGPVSVVNQPDWWARSDSVEIQISDGDAWALIHAGATLVD